MEITTATEARQNFYKLIEKVDCSDEPVYITKRNCKPVVLVSQREWESMKETLYLKSIPGMAESIKEGMKTSLEECSTELEWD